MASFPVRSLPPVMIATVFVGPKSMTILPCEYADHSGAL
jgi:hypothetical protein